jgi:hypothetical protein
MTLRPESNGSVGTALSSLLVSTLPSGVEAEFRLFPAPAAFAGRDGFGVR